MAGKRLLDIALLFNASKTVAKQHLKLRSQQLEAYNKTSSVTKAAKDHTDHITLTVKAALAIATRLSGPDSPSTVQHTTARRTFDNEPVSGPDPVDWLNSERNIEATQGLEQDHHYDRYGHITSTTTLPNGDLRVHKAQPTTSTTSDSSNSPIGAPINTTEVNDDIFSSREGSCQGKQPISPLASPNGSTAPGPEKLSQLPSIQTEQVQRAVDLGTQIPIAATAYPKIISDQTAGAELFYARPQDSYPVVSSLPRSNIPKHAETELDSQTPGVNGDLNPEEFYKASNLACQHEATAIEQDPIQAGVDLNIFRSQKTAKALLGQQKGDATSSDRNKQFEQDEHEDVRRLAAHIATETSEGAERHDEIRDSSNWEHIKETQHESQPMRESKVPSSRIGRLWEYGGLATSMAFGVVGETIRRATGTSTSSSSLMLSAGNMERLVAKLSRMRGAALKLGQMMSFQDSKMLPGPIHEVLLRVQDHADYMPASQRNKVLSDNLGFDWRSLFSSFDEVPIAAASIGQVHRAKLAIDGTSVAVKIQYPGVANSISSDLNNLSILLTASRLLPKGLYLDKTIANARTELAWECDYVREAECQTRFKELIQDEEDIFTVPSVVSSASGKEVLTAELMRGTAVTKPSLNLLQDDKDWIGSHILRLCLRELTEFKYMQTDPNWTNFLFNPETRKIELLDFGATRQYPDKFVDPYIRILIAAAKGDKETIRDLSIQLGYLTGHESNTMLNAHVTSVLTLAEPFQETRAANEFYDFRDQTITERVRGLIPVMVRERLAPPPEETYSLHRKLSGAFLLLARLGSRVNCRYLFEQAIDTWEKGGGLRRVSKHTTSGEHYKH